MYAKRPMLALSSLAIVALACSFSFDLPNLRGRTVQTGPTQTETIQVAAPDSSPAQLSLKFAAGELLLSPGGEAYLVDGTATYNVAELKPVISKTSSGAEIASWVEGPNAVPLNFGSEMENTWDLSLGSQPMELTISAGAYRAEMDLGGLAITKLTVQDGASDVHLDFSKPNQETMEQFAYTTGASNVKLSGLANAKFAEMVFNGGAGSYTLDFSGQLESDARVVIKAGLGQVVLIIPQGIPVYFDVSGGLTNIDMQGSFQGGGRQFNQSASGPSLTIEVEMGAGNLTVRNP